MKAIRSLFMIPAAALLWCGTAFSAPPLPGGISPIQYYDIGAGIVQMRPVPLTNGWSVPLAGTCRYPNLLLQVRKNTGLTKNSSSTSGATGSIAGY